MLSSVLKDSGDIFTRLFDHRPFTNGEINYFIREFEESRKGREQRRLKDIELAIQGIKKCQIKDQQTVLNNFNKLNTLIDIATQSCETILETEKNIELNDVVKENRLKRMKQWESFNREMETKMTEIDTTFVEKEKELIEMYKDLDKKLHLSS